jgi:toluene monooxygenase system ferredoxin subunit
MSWVPALSEDELWIGEMVGLQVEGRPVLLVNIDGNVRAYEDRCLHRSLPLSLGRLAENRLICRAHEWEYDACTGAGLNPTGVVLRRYDVRRDDGRIWVNLDAV